MTEIGSSGQFTLHEPEQPDLGRLDPGPPTTSDTVMPRVPAPDESWSMSPEASSRSPRRGVRWWIVAAAAGGGVLALGVELFRWLVGSTFGVSIETPPPTSSRESSIRPRGCAATAPSSSRFRAAPA
jgi:hypothetical protein